METTQQEWIEAKEQVFDRIEQCFDIFVKHFPTLFIPMFIYSLIAIIFTSIATYISLLKLDSFLDNTDTTNANFSNIDFYELFYKPETLMLVITLVILLIIYMTLYIPFLLWAIKSTSQVYKWEAPDWTENIKYWFKNLWNSFKTYWYNFVYVAIIPAILFIIGWITLIYGMQFNNDSITSIWWTIAVFSLVLFVVFSIYRWIKASFFLSSAVDKNEYTKDNFKHSISVTKNNFWRILWNLLLIWLLWGIIISMFEWVINIFTATTVSDSTIELLAWLSGEENPIESLKIISKELISSYSPLANMVSSILNWALNTVFSTFVIVFTYVLFKRLEIENSGSNSQEKETITQTQL